MAASITTQTHYMLGNIRKVIFDITFDDTDGSFVPVAISVPIEGKLLSLLTDPVALPQPDAYDVTLVNQHGHDVLQGVGAGRLAATVEKVPIVIGATETHPVVESNDTLTLTIINQITFPATTVIELYYALGI